jgi:hypothetical protein
MYVCALLLALHLPGENVLAPAWYHDYGRAQLDAAPAGKPMAVFIGSQGQGPGSLSADGKLSQEVRRLLQEFYVCVYIDVGHAEHGKLVAEFETGDMPLLVLSDVSGAYQSFRHAGKLDNTQLARVLQNCGEPEGTPPTAPAPPYCRS